jgi:hypothetical protein
MYGGNDLEKSEDAKSAKLSPTGYLPMLAAAYVSSAVEIDFKNASAAASLAFAFALSRLGIDKAASKAMIATTIIISTNVKADVLFFINERAIYGA